MADFICANVLPIFAELSKAPWQELHFVWYRPSPILEGILIISPCEYSKSPRSPPKQPIKRLTRKRFIVLNIKWKDELLFVKLMNTFFKIYF